MRLGADPDRADLEECVACCEHPDCDRLVHCLCLTVCVGATSPLREDAVHYCRSFLENLFQLCAAEIRHHLFVLFLLVSLPLFLRTVILLLGAVIKYLWNISDR